MITLFAQATNAPNNGASNAQDFQPPTRDPQPTGGGLQPGSVPQNTTTQDILSNENAQITVPVGSGQTVTPPPKPPTGGMSWFLLVVIVAAGIAAGAYALWRRSRSYVAAPKKSVRQEILVVPADEPEPQPDPARPAAVASPEKKSRKSSTRPKKSKNSTKNSKSKSKRKKSRK
ncbi:MAG TPA: hypothetical protein VK674_06270 [Candidatus Limnocylindria bacterium]|nr:hypothetical protein [Candidatus Limnocylindria bacterium]